MTRADDIAAGINAYYDRRDREARAAYAAEETARRSIAANRAAKRARVYAAQCERVRAMLAEYPHPADVPGTVWDAVIRATAAGGGCYADAYADVADVCPPDWSRDAIAYRFADAADRYADDERDAAAEAAHASRWS